MTPPQGGSSPFRHRPHTRRRRGLLRRRAPTVGAPHTLVQRSQLSPDHVGIVGALPEPVDRTAETVDERNHRTPTEISFGCRGVCLAETNIPLPRFDMSRL